MTRVVAYVPDLLFGSRVQTALQVAYTVELVGDEARLRSATRDAQALVVDLTADPWQRLTVIESLSSEGVLDGVRTLAFYSHVEVDTRVRAEAAGFDLVVARSRMAREGAALVERLLA
jgi:hypothetical protein